MPRLRVLFDPPGEGAWNMAVDEALLATAAAEGQATLRLYSWQQATLSLGYFQSAAERQLHAASLSCPLVRRSSGGGAILHDRELTYSLAMPGQPTAAAARRLYESVHGSLIAVLASFHAQAALFRDLAACSAAAGSASAPAVEPFLCFQRLTCFDVVAAGQKIAGSAQRRRGRAVLQHGSVLLAASPFAPELPGIEETTGVRLPLADLASALPAAVATALEMEPERGILAESERQMAVDFVRGRFGSQEFTQRR